MLRIWDGNLFDLVFETACSKRVHDAVHKELAASIELAIAAFLQRKGRHFQQDAENHRKSLASTSLNHAPQVPLLIYCLVCDLEHSFSMFFQILGISSSQLTFIFFRAVETTNQL